MKEKAIRKVKYLYYVLCRATYTILMTVNFIIHHYDEYKYYTERGEDGKEVILALLYKYYPKWRKYNNEALKYK